MVVKLLKDFFTSESGQGITEYGAILAFVALIIAIVFGLKGSFQAALTNAFSSVSNQLNSISTTSS